MAVRDHINRVNKLRAQIVTVDPSQRLIQVVTADGGLRQLSVYDIPSQFTWPLEGEEWSIYEENGYWYLGNKWLNPDEDEEFKNLSPGDTYLPSNGAIHGSKFLTLIEAPNHPTLVTSLPSSPVDGQEIYLQTSSMALDGVRWHLAYREASLSPYKWEFVGGGSLRSWAQTQVSTSGTTYVDLSGGPSLTIPVAGDYIFTFSVQQWANTALDSARAALKIGSTATTDDESAPTVSSTAGAFHNPSRTMMRNVQTAGSVCKLQYRGSSANSVEFMRRELLAYPVRVG